MLSYPRYLLLFAFLTIYGCGSLGNLIGSKEEIVDPPAELVEFQASLDVSRKWDRSTGKGTNKHYLTLAPVVVDDRVFIADTNRKVIAMNADNGRNIWTYELSAGSRGFWSDDDNVTITGGPGYGDGTIFIGSNKGHIVAINAETGQERWKARVSSEVLTAPTTANGIVVVRSHDGKIHGIDIRDGRALWVYEKSVPPLTLRGNSSPVIEDGVVVCGFDNGRLSALDISSSRLIWDISTSTPSGRSELERMIDINADPVIADGVVYVATFQGQLTALTLGSGRMLWSREISSYAGLSVDQNNLYVTDDKSVIWAINRFDGSPVWKQEGLLNREVTAPASIGNYIAAGDFEGYLHWMNKTTGAFVARQKISGDRIIAAPVAAGNTLYTFATDGRLAALMY